MSRLDHVTVTWRLAGLCGASSARQHCGSRRGGRSATGQEETERERWPAGLEITGDIHRATAAGIKHIKNVISPQDQESLLSRVPANPGRSQQLRSRTW